MARRTKIFVNKSKTKWIEVERLKPGTYGIVSNNLTNGLVPKLGFTKWDRQVKCLDPRSDDMVMCKTSCHLHWQNVVMNLDSNEFRVNSLARLREALQHVTFVAWDPGDI